MHADNLSRFGLDKAEDEGKVALANLQANIVSTLQAGCFLGAIVTAPIADRFGRKPSLIGASVVVMAGILMQFNSWGNLPCLYVGRFVGGIGVGACSVLVSEGWYYRDFNS